MDQPSCYLPVANLGSKNCRPICVRTVVLGDGMEIRVGAFCFPYPVSCCPSSLMFIVYPCGIVLNAITELGISEK